MIRRVNGPIFWWQSCASVTLLSMKKSFFAVYIGLVFLVGCTSSPRIVWVSEPAGDEAPDTREPSAVCMQLQTEKSELKTCALLESKSSDDEKECVDGMSNAGCFACKFECR